MFAQLFPILTKYLVDVYLIFDVLLLLFEGVPFYEVPFGFDCVVLVVKFDVVDLCGVD
jgi:hypothetical protein